MGFDGVPFEGRMDGMDVFVNLHKIDYPDTIDGQRSGFIPN